MSRKRMTPNESANGFSFAGSVFADGRAAGSAPRSGSSEAIPAARKSAGSRTGIVEGPRRRRRRIEFLSREVTSAGAEVYGSDAAANRLRTSSARRGPRRGTAGHRVELGETFPLLPGARALVDAC